VRLAVDYGGIGYVACAAIPVHNIAIAHTYPTIWIGVGHIGSERHFSTERNTEALWINAYDPKIVRGGQCLKGQGSV